MRAGWLLLTVAIFSAGCAAPVTVTVTATATVTRTTSQIAIITVTEAGPLVFVGSDKSDVYHYPGCIWAAGIAPANLLHFYSVEEARYCGYKSCSVCKPP